MRPQDVAILLKICLLDDHNWQMAVLANSVKISISEVSESLNRSQFAGLLDPNKKKVNRLNLVEFLEHGLRYVFPQQPGAMVRGVLTAHSHSFMKSTFISEVNYVWPDHQAAEIGLAIEPFYTRQTEATKEDPEFYKLLALVDVLRVGKVREFKYALSEIKKIILA